MDGQHYRHELLNELLQATGKTFTTIAKELDSNVMDLWRHRHGQSLSFERLQKYAAYLNVDYKLLLREQAAAKKRKSA